MIRLELKATEGIYFHFGENNITKIKEFFTKKNYSKEHFKPGSQKAIEAEKEHLKVMLLPDHDIKEIGEVTFKYGHQKLSFTLMEHTYDVPLRDYDYDDTESYCVPHKSRFLVENSYWGYGLLTSYGELAQNINYQNLLRLELDDQLRQEAHKELEEMPKPFSSLLLNKITEAKRELRTVRYYREYHGLGEAVVITDPFSNNEHVYSEKELKPIYQDMLDEKVFYDNSDCKLEIKYGESYIDFHKRASAVD